MEPGEILLVPHLTIKQRLRSHGQNSAFMRSFARSLRENLEKAAHDPSGPVGNGQPVRFSSAARMAAWLIGNRDISKPYEVGLFADMPGVSDLQGWIRRSLLHDAPALAQCASSLHHRRQLVSWLATLDDQDLAIIERTLAQGYAIRPSAVSAEPESVDAPTQAPPIIPLLSTRLEGLRKSLIEQRALQQIPSRHRRIAALLLWCAVPPPQRQGVTVKQFVASIASTAAEASVAIQPQFAREEAERGTSSKSAAHSLSGSELRQDTQMRGTAGHGDRPGPPSLAPRSFDSVALDTIGNTGAPNERGALEPLAEGAPSSPAGNHDDLANHLVSERSWPEMEDRFSSEFCGLLYLVNPLRRLGFSNDFGLDQSASEDFAPFALVDRLGAFWFGTNYLRSSLHHWLVKNSAPTRLPSHFVHPSIVRDASGQRAGSLVRDGRHLTIWHDLGYPLLDIPGCRRKREIIAAAGRNTLKNGRVFRASKGQKLSSSPGGRWIAALARTIETDLSLRSGDEDLSTDALRSFGDVRIIDCAITVHFDLSDLPFAVRFAGLDRDPGWIHQEGRSLAFVYR